MHNYKLINKYFLSLIILKTEIQCKDKSHLFHKSSEGSGVPNTRSPWSLFAFKNSVPINKECSASNATISLNQQKIRIFSSAQRNLIQCTLNSVISQGLNHLKKSLMQENCNIGQKFKKIKQNICQKLNAIESSLKGLNQEEFREGEEEQIVKGKINNILSNGIWLQVFDMINNKVSEQQILKQLKENCSNKSQNAFESLTQLQKFFTFELDNLIQKLALGNLPKKNSNKFSNTMKNINLRTSQNQQTVTNSSQYGRFFLKIGHYFCVTENDFDIHHPLYKFNIGVISPQTSYWFGFTFPSKSESRKWTNIYDQGQGGFFIVVFQSGTKINFWNHEKPGVSIAEQVSVVKVKSYSLIELSINFESKQLFFYITSEGKRVLVKQIKPLKWFGKIYPTVGFYGNQGVISLQ